MKLYFPIVNLEVTASVGASDSVSAIELLVLRAVLAGCDRLSDLRGLFGLPIRMTMHLVTGLVRRNLVLVDFATGHLKVPQGLAAKIAEREPHSNLRGSGAPTTQPQQLRFSLNKCTGRLRRETKLRLPGPDALVIRPPTGWIEPDDLEPVAIIDALNHQLRTSNRQVFDLDKGTMRLVSEGYLEAEIRAVDWGDGGALTLAFAEIHQVSASEVASLEEMLVRTKTEAPEWWERLRPERVRGPMYLGPGQRVLPQSLSEEAARLRARTGQPLAPRDLARLLRRVATHVESASQVRLAIGSEQVWDEAAALLAGARRQVLLMTPFLVEAPAAGLLDARSLTAAVHVVHGINTTLSESQAAAATALSAMPRVCAQADRGASTHAKLLVQDDRCALVGSKNLLSSGRSSASLELGVILAGERALSDVLAWLRVVVTPEARTSWRITAPAMGVPLRSDYRLPPSESLPNRFDVLVRRIADEFGPRRTATECAAYARTVEAWTEVATADYRDSFIVDQGDVASYLEELADGLDHACHATVELVPTELHRPLLFDALERARNYVAITSHQIGASALGANLRGAILSALRRGVGIALAWGADAVSSADPEQPSAVRRLVDDLRVAAQGLPGRLVINDRPLSLHCKVVVVDGEVAIVSSFEFLHFADTPGYRRHELGCWLESKTIARAVMAAVSTHAEAKDPTFATSFRELSTTSTPSTV